MSVSCCLERVKYQFMLSEKSVILVFLLPGKSVILVSSLERWGENGKI